MWKEFQGTSLEFMTQGVNVSTPFIVVNRSAFKVRIIGAGPAYEGIPGRAVVEF